MHAIAIVGFVLADAGMALLVINELYVNWPWIKAALRKEDDYDPYE